MKKTDDVIVQCLMSVDCRLIQLDHQFQLVSNVYYMYMYTVYYV